VGQGLLVFSPATAASGRNGFYNRENDTISNPIRRLCFDSGRQVPDVAPTPLMRFSDIPNWPPAWVWIDGVENKHSRGEIGILTTEEASNVPPISKITPLRS
jgi:hypothetical protein